MVLQTDAGAARRTSRGWAVAAAVGVLSTAVVLSGLGFAAADDTDPPKAAKVKPAKKAPPVEVEGVLRVVPVEAEGVFEIVLGDDEPAKPAAPKAKAPAQKSAVADLKKKIAAAAKEGNAEEVAELVEKLEKALAARPAVAPLPPVPPVPPVPPSVLRPVPAPPAPPAPPADKLEAAEKALKKALEGLEDRPEVKEAVTKALKEAMRAVEGRTAEARRAAEAAGRDAEARGREAAEQGRRAGEEARRAAEAFRERATDRARAAQRQAADAERQAADAERQAADAAQAEKAAKKPRLGVSVGEVSDEKAEEVGLKKAQGVLVIEVVKGTPAEKAGVKADDIILTVAGKAVNEPGELVEVLGGQKGGAEIEIVLFRDGKKAVLKGVKLASPDAAPAKKEKPADPQPKKAGGSAQGGGADAKPRVLEFKVEGVEGADVVKRVPLKVEGRLAEVAPRVVEVEGGRLFLEGVRPVAPAEVKPAAGKVKFESTNISINDGEFRIEAKTGETAYRVAGSVENGKPVVSEVRVTAGEQKPGRYKTLDAVPAEHQAAVKQLLSSVGGGR